MAIYFETNNLKKMKIPTIKDVLKKEETKHGKKSADYSIIKELGELKLSDVAIYAGMYLAKRKQKPYYTVSDLKHILTEKDFIDDELIPLLDRESKFNKLDSVRKKSKALILAQNVIDNEAEVIQMVNNHLLAQSKDVTLAHQMSVKQLNEMYNIIKNVVDTMQTIYDEDDRELVNLMQSLNWKKAGEKSTTYFLNTVIRDVSSAIGLSLRDMKEMKQEGGLSEREVAALNSLKLRLEDNNKELNKFESINILWPESENDIEGLPGIRKYLIEIERYRLKAKSVIDQYKKRKDKLINVKSEDDEDNELIEMSNWNFEKVHALARQSIKDLYETVVRADVEERQEMIFKLAKDLLEEHKGLEKFLSQDSYDPEGELVGILTKIARDPNITKGRKKGDVENENI